MKYDANANIPTDPARLRRLEAAARSLSTDPRAHYERLRKIGPLDFEEGKNGNVQVLREADVQTLVRDWQRFSNDVSTHGSAAPLIPLGIDPPLHSSYRRMLNPYFSPSRMNLLAPAVTGHVNRLIDTFIDKGECDFSTEVAVPLPCSSFLTLLGLPQDELDELVGWARILLRPDTEAGSIEAGLKLQAETVQKVYARFADAVAERSEKPQEDFISYLLSVKLEDERPLRDDEIAQILFTLLAAGLDTVTVSLQCIFYYLLEHPEARELAREEPANVPNMIEELLRWETPVQTGVARRATQDTELAGCPIKEGTLLLPNFGAANVDPDVSGWGQVDLRRKPSGHLAFGSGKHRCLGLHLARLELRTVIEEWHRRIPEYQLKPGVAVEWNGSSPRGLDHLPTVWSV